MLCSPIAVVIVVVVVVVVVVAVVVVAVVVVVVVVVVVFVVPVLVLCVKGWVSALTAKNTQKHSETTVVRHSNGSKTKL